MTRRSFYYTRYLGTGLPYYYDLVRFQVSDTGVYIFQSSSNIDLFGSLYKNYFIRTVPSKNLIAYDDLSGGNNQFRFVVFLKTTEVYYLVTTTSPQNRIGEFTITATGTQTITFQRIDSE